MIPSLYRPWTLRTLRRHPDATRAEVLAFQAAWLRRVVAHAYRHVPYYRELFERHGIRPDEIRAPADLRRIPITKRKTLAELPLDAIATRGLSRARLVMYSTSGSSGRPLRVHRTWAENRVEGSFFDRMFTAFGVRRDDRVATTIALRGGGGGGVMHRLLAFLRPSWSGAVVDCGLQATEMLARLRALRPTVLQGYPGLLARLARTLDRTELRALGVRRVLTGGEVLTPAMRHDIGAGFGASVHDYYASHEFGVLAWQCGATDVFHTNDDGLVLELLRPDGTPAAPGEQGVVVGTSLYNFAVPLLRYELGDLAEPGPAPCSCGQPFGTLRALVGRVTDEFTMPDGRVVHPYSIFIPIRYTCPWLRAFRVTQHERGRFVMHAVVAPGTSADEVARMDGTVRAALGRDVAFALEVVPELDPDANGKFRMYRSLVTADSDRR